MNERLPKGLNNFSSFLIAKIDFAFTKCDLYYFRKAGWQYLE